jgi:hypothetical protein
VRRLGVCRLPPIHMLGLSRGTGWEAWHAVRCVRTDVWPAPTQHDAVQMADEAFCLGAAPARSSYLNVEVGNHDPWRQALSPVWQGRAGYRRKCALRNASSAWGDLDWVFALNINAKQQGLALKTHLSQSFETLEAPILEQHSQLSSGITWTTSHA